jgi:RNA polymerase sigma-70 factor (ECF subfamily)
MHETQTSLLRRVRDPADRDSWGEFVALYEPLLLSYVRKKGLRDHDAQDVVQSIFISLFRALPTFSLDHGRGRFRTWLWQITSNAVNDYLRKRRRIDRVEDEKRQQFDEAPTPEPDPEWLATHRKRLLEFAMQQVKSQTAPKTWACFELHLLKGKPGAEVAEALELTANTVYVNASRVMSRIRELCRSYQEDSDDE